MLREAKAFVSLYGNLLFWVGMWDLLWFWGPPTLGREVGYALAGLVLTLGSDTLHANGAVGSGWMSAETAAKRWVTNARIVFGLIGSLMLWVGIFDIEAEHFLLNSSDPDERATQPALLKDCLMLFAGLVGLRWLGVYFEICNMPLSDPHMAPCLGACCDSSEHADGLRDNGSAEARVLRTSWLATLSVCAQCALWLGLWNLLENYGKPSWVRELLYMGGGLALCHMAGALKLKENLNANQDELYKPQAWSGWVECRALVSCIGQFMHIVGAWTVFDMLIGSFDSAARNWLYCALGIAGMAWAGSLSSHAGTSAAPMAMTARGSREERMRKVRQLLPQTGVALMQESEALGLTLAVNEAMEVVHGHAVDEMDGQWSGARI
jgi:hypothetical protein